MEKIKNWIKKNKVIVIVATFIFLLINYTSRYFRVYNENILESFNYVFSNPLILLEAFPLSLNSKDIMFSFLGLGVFTLFYLDKQSNKKTFRKGSEYGSAEWGDPSKDLQGMYSSKASNNIIFTEKVKMAIDNKELENYKFHRNKNTLIIGGSGSGKTRFFVKPNIMQMNSDFVVTDPKGDILNDLGYMLRAKKNYDIKVLNLIDFDKSMKYNPLAYVKEEQDILKIIETIIKNTGGKDSKDDFWVGTEKLLYQALLGAIMEYFPEEERHLGTLSDLIPLTEVKENDEDYISVVDEMFQEIEEHSPDAFCLKQYKAFKSAAGESAKSILISCATRLAPINIPAVRELLSSNELQIDELGNKPLLDEEGNLQFDEKGNVIYQPCAFFIIIPDTDTTFNFIAGIMYTQMFNQLVTLADTKYNGELPRHVRFLLDEFANIGEIPNFQILIATIRSRNISVTPILQTLAQLKNIYKDNSDTIVGNCDTLVFLGGKEDSTLKLISNQLGKQTIDDYNTSRTRSQNDSYGQNYSKLGRELMTPDELQKMDRGKAIVTITGLPPFIDNKYKIEDHPNYKYHGKAPVKNKLNGKIIKEGKHWFDTDKYIYNYRKIYNKMLREEQKKKENEGMNIEYEFNYEETLEQELYQDENFDVSVIDENMEKQSIYNKNIKENTIKSNKKPVKAI